MIILTIRTERPGAEICLYDDQRQIKRVSWEAHRQLAETLHVQIGELLQNQHKTLADVEGVACYKGPGSFTGLRIGLSVANAIAYAISVPIVGETGENWQESAIKSLLAGDGRTMAFPEYGAEVHITLPNTQPRH
jgi:tRNA threonylcarbamoyladenosine biosynthesis protein TsaB